MAQYTVRSGQNIYDVALTLYGSVDGIFDLLVSNDWLSMTTKLSYGMVLEYHGEFAINKDVTLWLQDHNVLVKNGEYCYTHTDMEALIRKHIEEHHPEIIESFEGQSPDEQSVYWENLYYPRMIIKQQGQLSTIMFKLKAGKHLIIDWGDLKPIQILEGDTEQEIEHCYKGNGNHTITLYGDFEFEMLDLTNLNGVYYPLGAVMADEFITTLKIKDLNKLIITQ